ncbi:MAG: hypothetical protein SFX19_07720 [Alphaproteobacteria bacterium]|nr:hypothetical protein [Alphaproteobacteria bacterium]
MRLTGLSNAERLQYLVGRGGDFSGLNFDEIKKSIGLVISGFQRNRDQFVDGAGNSTITTSKIAILGVIDRYSAYLLDNFESQDISAKSALLETAFALIDDASSLGDGMKSLGDLPDEIVAPLQAITGRADDWIKIGNATLADIRDQLLKANPEKNPEETVKLGSLYHTTALKLRDIKRSTKSQEALTTREKQLAKPLLSAARALYEKHRESNDTELLLLAIDASSTAKFFNPELIATEENTSFIATLKTEAFDKAKQFYAYLKADDGGGVDYSGQELFSFIKKLLLAANEESAKRNLSDLAPIGCRRTVDEMRGVCDAYVKIADLREAIVELGMDREAALDVERIKNWRDQLDLPGSDVDQALEAFTRHMDFLKEKAQTIEGKGHIEWQIKEIITPVMNAISGGVYTTNPAMIDRAKWIFRVKGEYKIGDKPISEETFSDPEATKALLLQEASRMRDRQRQ